MPCELFDRLLRDGWTDVTETDYSDRAIFAWEQSDKANWKIRYFEQIDMQNSTFQNALHGEGGA